MTGGQQHRQIVGPVADRQGLRQLDPHAGRLLLQRRERVLRAAAELVRYQRERLRVESADGRTVSWLHALRDGRPVVASRFSDDEGTIPLYEQIYAVAGLTQYYRITGDTEVLADIEKTVRFMDQYYWDAAPANALARGYFSHIHPGTLRPEDAAGPNARKIGRASCRERVSSPV